VRARSDEIAEQSRRRTLQATWRLDDLQQLRAHDKAHGR